jgi:hypothetical protein
MTPAVGQQRSGVAGVAATCRVGVGVLEDVERSVAVVDRQVDGLAAFGVFDRD